MHSYELFCRRFTGLASLVVASLVLLSGCDSRPKRVPVAGTVLIDGKPLNKGFVFVYPANNRPAIGTINAEGKFTLTTFEENDGCVLGTHPVSVIVNEQITPTRMKWLAPKKYADVATTDQKITIEKPVDDLVIELTWAGGKPFVEDTGGGGDIDPHAPPSTATPAEKAE